jgi:hypothetical protein
MNAARVRGVCTRLCYFFFFCTDALRFFPGGVGRFA